MERLQSIDSTQVRIERLVFDGQEHARTVLELIQQSERSICISCYIVKADRFGESVLDLLRERSKKGVQVRLIVDGYGSSNWIKFNKKKFENRNFEIRIYHPLPWPLSKLKLSHLPRLDRLFLFLLNANRRNHQKLFIFDEKIVILGSRNINDDALNWRETSLVVRGAPLAYLKSIFENIWKRSHKRLLSRITPVFLESDQKLPSPIISNHAFKLKKQRDKVILSQIRSAKYRIYLTTPYLFPSKPLLEEIKSKSESGVDVRVLIPHVSDVWISKWIAQLHYRDFLCAGVKIYEYSASILHAKSVLIDDWALIGSSNFNRRSALRDLEIDYSPSSPETRRQLHSKFMDDIRRAKSITSLPRMGFIKQLIAWIAYKLFPTWF